MKQNMETAAQAIIERSIERHGGMARYERIDHIVCDVTSMTGLAIKRRGLNNNFPMPKIVTLMPRQRKAVLHDFPVPGRSCIFDQGRVAEVAAGQEPVFECDNYRDKMMSVSRFRRPWTMLDAVYFFGYAMTHYASLPYSLRGIKVLGLKVRDSGDWHARLDVEHPADAHTHCQREAIYFDKTGLLVRHDYATEVSSPIARAANFLLDYRSFDDYLITERRKVFFRLGRMVTPLVVMDACIKVREVALASATHHAAKPLLV